MDIIFWMSDTYESLQVHNTECFHLKTVNCLHVSIKNTKFPFKLLIVLSLKINNPGSVIMSGGVCTNVSLNCINRCSGMCVCFIQAIKTNTSAIVSGKTEERQSVVDNEGVRLSNILE